MEAEEIKAIRLKLGLTQQEMANRIGATKTSQYKWESKRSKPHRLFISKLEELRKEAENI